MSKPTMQPDEISEVLSRPMSQELLARDLTRLAYVAKDGTPRKLIDFETTLPSAVEELIRQQAERQRT